MHTETTGAAGGVTGYVPAQRQEQGPILVPMFSRQRAPENTVYRYQPLDDL
jgi:hypothetical protein